MIPTDSYTSLERVDDRDGSSACAAGRRASAGPYDRAMPKRSTQKQRVVYLLRKALAPETWTVTESKMLYDPSIKREREVDVVVEGRVNEVDVVISFEVRDVRRRVTLEWIEAMLGKHEHLPTDKLALVSWNGFTKGAIEKAEQYPNLLLVTPRIDDAGNRVLQMYSLNVLVGWKSLTAVVQQAAGRRRRQSIDVLPERPAYNTAGELVGTVREVLEGRGEQQGLIYHVAEFALRERFEGRVNFTLRSNGKSTGFFVRTEDGTLAEVRRLSGQGTFMALRCYVDVERAWFDTVEFSHGELKVHDLASQIVFTVDNGTVRSAMSELEPVEPREPHTDDDPEGLKLADMTYAAVWYSTDGQRSRTQVYGALAG